MADSFRISATGLSPYYLPEYVADAMGYFEEVGIKKESYVPEPWTQVMVDIDTGAAEAVIGGIWVPMMYQRRGKDYRSFCRLAAKSPLSLFGRKKPDHPFRWTDLENKLTLCAGAHSIGIGVIVGGAAKEYGCDMSKVQITHDLPANMLMELFLGGMGDYIAVAPDVALTMEKEGKGYLVTNLCESAGPCPHSAYYATGKALDEKTELFGRFCVAMQKGFDFVNSHCAEDMQELLFELWPKKDREAIKYVIDLFIKNGMWDKTIRLTETECYRWQRMIKETNYVIDEIRPYEEVVDERPWKYAAEKLGIEA